MTISGDYWLTFLDHPVSGNSDRTIFNVVFNTSRY